jgi:hypothetical protein
VTAANSTVKETRWSVAALARNAAIAGVMGLVLWIIGVLVEPRQAYASYLFAYAFALTIAVGALLQVMMSHVTGARWFTVLRRLTLTISASLPVLAILVIPVLLGVGFLYPWAHPADLSAEAQKLALHRKPLFNVPFFVVRAIIYVLVFALFGEIVRRWALREDTLPPGANVVEMVQKQRRLSAGGLVAVGLAISCVAFDWLMPLDPLWYSTVYAVYVFAGAILAALGLVALIADVSARNGGALAGTVTPAHFGALGKLMITFVIFWLYIAFSQFLVIWIGDIPADSSWYVIRGAGSWGILALVVAFGQFALPFVLLVSRSIKRRPAALGAIGAWLVIMHVIDVYWLVLPAFHTTGIHVSWIDAAALLMVCGFATAGAAWRATGHVALPINDPYLPQSVRYVEP